MPSEERLRMLGLPSLKKRKPRDDFTAPYRSLRRGSRGRCQLCFWKLMAEWEWHRAAPGEGHTGY